MLGGRWNGAEKVDFPSQAQDLNAALRRISHVNVIEARRRRHDGLELGASINDLTVDLKPEPDNQDIILGQALDEFGAGKLERIDCSQRLQDLPRLVVVIQRFGVENPYHTAIH